MQRSPIRDFIVGLFVLSGLAAIGYLSIQVGGPAYKGPGGFALHATFDEVGGLKARAAVVIAGVKVGQVISIELDDMLRAHCELDVDPSLELDIDTSAAIMTTGLLGDQFIALEPGGADEMLQSGDAISRTTSALSIERLVGKLVNNTGLAED